MKRDEASPVMEGAVCPVPLAHDVTVVMGHGSGGRMTHDLVRRRFQRVLGNPALEQGDDAAVLPLPQGASESASLSVVIECFPVSLKEITKVSKYIFETAKSMGCYYTGVDIDVISDDDPRVQWESKG